MGSTAVEVTQHGADSCSPVKPMKPCIQVDNISVDTNSSSEMIEASEHCNHFSIRGYVAEVRKRDKKLCFPFVTNDGQDESFVNSYELPPINVPKFRWWQCDGCIQETGSQKSGEAQDLKHGLSSDPTCIASSSQRPDVAAAPVSLLKDHGRVSVLNAQEKKTFDLKTSADSMDNQTCTADPLGKEPASDGLQLDILLQDPPDDDSVVRRQGNAEFHLQASNIKGVSEAGLAREMSKSRELPAICWRGEHTSAATQNMDLQIPRVEAAETMHGGSTTIGRLVPLPDLNKCDDDGTLDNDEDVLGNNPCDDDEDDLRGGSRRKIRKTRLLSELLEGKERMNIEHLRREPSSECSSDRSDTPQMDQRETVVNENGYLHVSVLKRKIMPNDGGHRPFLIKGPCEGTKKLRTHDVDKENTKPSTTEDSETESDEDASLAIVTQPMAKRSQSLVGKHELEQNSKRAKVESKGSPIVSRQNTAPKTTMGKAWSADKHPPGADQARRMNQLVKSHENRQKVDKSPSMLKKKKVDHNMKQKPSFVLWKNFAHRDCSTVRHSESPLMKDTSSMKALNKRHTSIEKDKQSDQNESSLQSALQGLKITDDDPVVRKHSEYRNAGASGTFFTGAAPGPSARGPFDVNREEGTNQRSNAKGKGKMFPETSPDILPWSNHVVPPDTLKSRKTGESRGIRWDIDINVIPPDDKVSEQAPSDDIPMDIVNFMAKHQHERQGSFEKDKNFTSGLNVPAKAARLLESNSTSIPSVHRPVSTPYLWRDDFPYVQTLQPSSARNGAITGLYDPIPFKQKSTIQFPDVNRTYLNGVRATKPYSWNSSNGSARHHENLSREPKGPSLPLAFQNSSEDTLGQRSSRSSAQSLEQLNRFLTAPQQNRVSQMWASAMPKSSPQGLMNPGTFPRLGQDLGHLNFDNASLTKQLQARDPLMRPGGAMFLLNAIQLAGTKPLSQQCTNNGNLEFLRWPTDRTVQPCNQYAASVGGGHDHCSSSKHHPSLDIDRRWNSNPQQLPYPSYHGLQNVSPFDAPFHNEPTVGRPPSGITNHLVSSGRGQMCASNPQASAQGGNLYWQPMQTNPSSDVGKKHVSTAGKGKGRILASSSSISPLHVNKDLSGQKRPEARVPLPSTLTEVCSENKNPAELDMDSGRKYMIEGEKLRPVKWSSDHRPQAKAVTKRKEKKQHLTARIEPETPKSS